MTDDQIEMWLQLGDLYGGEAVGAAADEVGEDLRAVVAHLQREERDAV